MKRLKLNKMLFLLIGVIIIVQDVVCNEVDFSINKDTVFAMFELENERFELKDSFEIRNNSEVDTLVFDSLTFSMQSDYYPDDHNWLCVLSFPAEGSVYTHELLSTSCEGGIIWSSYRDMSIYNNSALYLLPNEKLNINRIVLWRGLCSPNRDTSYLKISFYKNEQQKNLTIIGTDNRLCVDKKEFVKSVHNRHNVVVLPNPCNPNTSIGVSGLDPFIQLSLRLFDSRGNLIKMVSGRADAFGNVKFVWNGTNRDQINAMSGIYIAKLTGRNTNLSRKIVLIR